MYDQHVPVDQKLVKQMYKYAGPWSPGGYEERWEYGVSIKGEAYHHPDLSEEHYKLHINCIFETLLKLSLTAYTANQKLLT